MSDLAELAQQLRVDAVRCSEVAGSGHPTSSLSAAHLMAVLFARHLRYDFDHPGEPGNDRLIFSKGHASPLLYALYKAAGAISDDELVTYRALGSRLEGHPTPRLPWVDVATGALGLGLPMGVGLALTGKMLDRLPYRTWVLCGDSELAEGSNWEAFEHAGHERLDKLVAIIDVNRLGQRGPTRLEWRTDEYAARIGAFGWDTIEIDGHDLSQIDEALRAAGSKGRPTAILARTIKGGGVEAVADKEGKHGKPVSDARAAIVELGGARNIGVRVAKPTYTAPPHRFGHAVPYEPPRYEKGDDVATRDAFGAALAALGHARPDVVGLDAEVADSTRMQLFADEHPDRFFQFYIAEQQMLAAAIGMQARGWIPYAATFAAFLTRGYDIIRMAAIGRADLRLVGSHAGVAIGEDGPSQMGLEDIAAFRAVHSSTVLHPCDANQTAALVAEMGDRSGISYLRTCRGVNPVIYGPDEEFVIGGSRILRSSSNDAVSLIGAGVTVHEALRAADDLEREGVRARVIDLYSLKPVDAFTVRAAARETGCLITIEDHWPEGGLGDAVFDVFAGGTPPPALIKLAVRDLPGSAEPEEQLSTAGIDSAAIAGTVRSYLAERAVTRD
ncbi:transketolase [Phytoactinopolyspora alkaliphila]|uniref:Transketolase n=1 Tax=Phytoactinopolyspora alkaliphila TaxID=1783498 RepID=A0A6N9YLU7_9ACTN|nr:transketolase [Phytoactinopolyspora alkaliphila]NED95954.1 transketolase [Phytoactinopolyspora alkaliphila]